MAKDLDFWLGYIQNSEITALNHVIHELGKMTEDDDSSLDELARVILQDSAVTSQVLRVANSVQYNPSSAPITTISKALVFIGIRELKNITRTILMIQLALKGNPRPELMEAMARSFHAAIQARNLAFDLEPEEREEVFIAALLYNLGEMLFIGSDRPEVKEYLEYRKGGYSRVDASRKATGISFNELTLALTRDWRLTPILSQALENTLQTAEDHPLLMPVLLGCEISDIAQHGLESQAMKTLRVHACAYTGMSGMRIKQRLINSSEEAVTVASTYGAESVCQLIHRLSEDDQETKAVEETSHTSTLRCIQRLTEIANEDGDINQLLYTVLAGLKHGAQIKRVCVALISPVRKQLEARYLHGEGTENWMKQFILPIQDDNNGFLHYCLRHEGQHWRKSCENRQIEGKLKPLLEDTPDGFATRITNGKRVVGILYCDNDNEGLSSESFATFQLLSGQLNMALKLLTQNAKANQTHKINKRTRGH